MNHVPVPCLPGHHRPRAFLQPAAHAAEAAPHPGKALYERHCASCHDKPDVSRAVPFAQLRTMRLGNLFFAMTDGKMKAQSAALNEHQRGELVDFIVGRQQVDERWIDAMRCGRAERVESLWRRQVAPRPCRDSASRATTCAG